MDGYKLYFGTENIHNLKAAATISNKYKIKCCLHFEDLGNDRILKADFSSDNKVKSFNSEWDKISYKNDDSKGEVCHWKIRFNHSFVNDMFDSLSMMCEWNVLCRLSNISLYNVRCGKYQYEHWRQYCLGALNQWYKEYYKDHYKQVLEDAIRADIIEENRKITEQNIDEFNEYFETIISKPNKWLINFLNDVNLLISALDKCSNDNAGRLLNGTLRKTSYSNELFELKKSVLKIKCYDGELSSFADDMIGLRKRLLEICDLKPFNDKSYRLFVEHSANWWAEYSKNAILEDITELSYFMDKDRIKALIKDIERRIAKDISWKLTNKINDIQSIPSKINKHNLILIYLYSIEDITDDTISRISRLFKISIEEVLACIDFNKFKIRRTKNKKGLFSGYHIIPRNITVGKTINKLSVNGGWDVDIKLLSKLRKDYALNPNDYLINEIEQQLLY